MQFQALTVFPCFGIKTWLQRPRVGWGGGWDFILLVPPVNSLGIEWDLKPHRSAQQTSWTRQTLCHSPSSRVGKVGGGAEGRILHVSKYSGGNYMAFKGVIENTRALIFIRETKIICFPESYLLIEEARCTCHEHFKEPPICFLTNNFDRCRSIPAF